MHLKILPGDFVVEERARLALQDRGPWAVYRVRKVNLTTLEAQTRLARALGLPRKQVILPALKDKEAITYQFACLPADQPAKIEEERLSAQRLGFRATPLGVADLLGNRFTLIIRDLSPAEAERLAEGLAMCAQRGLPNYFAEQRFGSLVPGGEYPGRAILRRDAEAALRAHFTQPFVGDPPGVRAFKRRAAALWPDWRALMDAAPKPSNFRSVLTYLIDHPQGYRHALNLIPQRLLSLYLAAYQSALWNRIAAAYVQEFCTAQSIPWRPLVIAEQTLPIPYGLTEDQVAQLRAQRLALPSHQARFPSPLEPLVRRVLAEEGLALPDLKARILAKAYLPKGERTLWLLPEEMTVAEPCPDVRFPGRHALRVSFALARGSYATLVVQAAAALL